MGYCSIMQQMDVYFHDGCLSHRSLLSLAKELQRDCPAWSIVLHPLLEHEVTSLGFFILPTIVINGSTIATGLPNKDWLLKKMSEYDRASRQ